MFVPGPMLESAGSGDLPGETGTRKERRKPESEPTGRLVDWLAGTVVDATTNRPLSGVSIRIEPAAAPCPRLPSHGRPTGNVDPLRSGIDLREVVNARSDAEGRFAIQHVPGSHKGAVDLFAFADGYVTGCVCGIEDDMAIVVRLEPGKRIQGRVADPAGRPIEGAQVLAALPEGRTNMPGTTGETKSLEDGSFVLAELGTEAVVVMVDHPHYVPYASLPIDPGTGESQEVVLVPAWRLTFLMRSDDGEPLVHPTIQWKTSGEFPLASLELLAASPVGPPARPRSELRSEVVRIPTDRRTVDVEIKADGYLPWRTTDEPLPPDGGEREFAVTLERDRTIGSLAVRLVDEGGRPIHYVEAGAEVGLTWLGRPGDVSSAYVIEPADVLTLPGLKAGKWRLLLTAPGYGPSTTEVEVPAGGAGSVDVTMGPPARLRVRFRSPDRVRVEFRLLKDGRPVKAYPEVLEPTPRDDTTRLATPEDGGLVVSGLGSGAHVIEVLNDDLVPVRQAVTLEAGTLTDIEIEVRRR